MADIKAGFTHLLDLDGTLVTHNGHLTGRDRLLPWVKKYFRDCVKPDDTVIIITARQQVYTAQTLKFLKSHGLKFDQYIPGLPNGKRILINDVKPAVPDRRLPAIRTAHAISIKRNSGLKSVYARVRQIRSSLPKRTP